MQPEIEIFGALMTGEIDTVRRLLNEHPELVNARNENGDSLLLAAAYSGRRELFELILEKGAGVSLFEASAAGLADRALEQIEADPAIVNAYSHDGWTPLHLASFFGHREIAKLLLARGADVNARSRNTRFAKENTPLHAAAANRQVGVAV